jgi:non-ribosomal peptide synthetase-like protein
VTVTDTCGAGPGTGRSRVEVEGILSEVLAELLGVEQVSPGSDFFADLGADSMMMTRFCARVRKHDALPSLSMKDIYRHPSVGALASALAIAAAPADATPAGRRASAGPTAASEGTGPGVFAGSSPPEVAGEQARTTVDGPIVRSKPRYLLCGALQLLALIGLPVLGAFILAQGYEWMVKTSGLLGAAAGVALGTGAGADPVRAQLHAALFGSGVLSIYLRSVVYVVAGFLLTCALPIVAKWVLVGRWTRRQIPIWSLAYFRFWLVKTLIRTSPLVLFVGTPIYVAYLRSLGAKIAPGVAIFSQYVPVCTDLLTIGEDSVIRKDVAFACYRARGGMIETGPVTLGADALVSEATVLDIDTSLGHWSQLGHASSLHSGQAVPHGETWHGSPAQPADVDYRKVEAKPCGTPRRIWYSMTPLLFTLLVLGPLLISGADLVFTRIPRLQALFAPVRTALSSGTFWVNGVVASYLLFFGAIFLGLASLAVLPRLLNLVIRPGRIYHLYGFRYSVYRLVTRLTNLRFFVRLFGDSSFVTGYLRGVGYGLRPVVQTGSNFGSEFKQDSPYLTTIGSGTMIADGLSIVNADFTNSSFRLMQVSIGQHNFLGNKVTYPTSGRTGENCLLATKVMVPIDGKVRENVGLLGSPSFEIPRSVERDMKIGAAVAEVRARRLTAKNDHNVVTMTLYLLVWWAHFAVLLSLGLIAADRYGAWGMWAFAASGAVSLVFHTLYWILVDWSVRRLQAFEPAGCSIYDPAFWRHERFWKVCDDRYLLILNGTPFKSLVWRMLGVRIGRRVFDDGAFFPERSLVTIGDECTLNGDTHIQCHSQEDGAFKSDRTEIGLRCTLGVGAFIHYGVTVGDDVELLPDCFVMKGEQIPAGARWGGNPAREM